MKDHDYHQLSELITTYRTAESNLKKLELELNGNKSISSRSYAAIQRYMEDTKSECVSIDGTILTNYHGNLLIGRVVVVADKNKTASE